MAAQYIKAYIILVFLHFTSVNAKELKFDETKFKESLAPAIQFRDHSAVFQLQDRMKRYGASGVSIAIVKNNDLIFTKAYGYIAKNSTVLVNEQTLFQAASISKPITALGIMHRLDGKKLSLDEPINNYLNSWKFNKGKPLTLRQLLSHTAGVNNASYSGYEQGAELPNLFDILNGIGELKAVKVELPIGQYNYSGGGYSLLQLVIENVFKQSFSQFMHSELFKTFNAPQSHFKIMDHSSKFNIAKGHGYSGNTYPSGWFNYPQKAAAGLWSTPTDIANLLIAYMKSYQGVDSKMMSKEQAKEVATVVESKMGLGFGVHGKGIDLHIDHAGWNKGYRAYMVAFPELGDAVVVMANSNYSNRLIEEIMRSVSGQFEWDAYKSTKLTLANWKTSKFQELVGSYRFSKAGFSVEIYQVDNYLELKTPRGTTHQLYPISKNSLVMLEDGAVIKVLENGILNFWGMNAHKI
ncbi:serine hydrolase domain-containing protein [Thalassotalea sp. G2M2-11]|uniref:serine hydrolase domain-containing protein n=1 Tax=Thalassotalea sp. G2M2-11 TaxID=2787627 RepID=UPI0019D1E0BF|nr:serine hydrolase domain-containing protein [Thalassotalea sp. G2M2-11]